MFAERASHYRNKHNDAYTVCTAFVDIGLNYIKSSNDSITLKGNNIGIERNERTLKGVRRKHKLVNAGFFHFCNGLLNSLCRCFNRSVPNASCFDSARFNKHRQDCTHFCDNRIAFLKCFYFADFDLSDSRFDRLVIDKLILRFSRFELCFEYFELVFGGSFKLALTVFCNYLIFFKPALRTDREIHFEYIGVLCFGCRNNITALGDDIVVSACRNNISLGIDTNLIAVNVGVGVLARLVVNYNGIRPANIVIARNAKRLSVKRVYIALGEINAHTVFVKKALIADLNRRVNLFADITCTRNDHTALGNCKVFTLYVRTGDLFGNYTVAVDDNILAPFVLTCVFKSAIYAKIIIPTCAVDRIDVIHKRLILRK